MNRAGAGWSVGLVVPAHDEAATIGSALDAALRALRRVDDAWVVVVADACRDGSATIAQRRLEGRGEVLRTDARCVGVARRLGAAAVARRFSHRPAEKVWLLSTDADTWVPEDWAEVHLRHADAGLAAVAGVVRIEGKGALADRFADRYALPVSGPHRFVHGANLGVRLDAYLDAGGWPPLPRDEDRQLWRKLKAAGWPVEATSRSWVATSGRPRGRVLGGFGDWLGRGCVEAVDG